MPNLAQAPTWDVVGVDNHGGALERGRALAASSASEVRFVKANVRRQPLDELTPTLTPTRTLTLTLTLTPNPNP